VTKKRDYKPRVPGIACPHCDTRSIAYDSVQQDLLTRDIRFACRNPECGHTFVAQLAIYRTVRPSDTPNPAVPAWLGEVRAKPANDDTRTPANDDAPDAAALPAPS
jgi:hypothetical protein